MLDRLEAETGRATSIVRYGANSYFSPHNHDGGEEFLVLEGIFSDEHGDYPLGTYVRNPINTQHTPFSAEGCIIFVKLFQFDPEDQTQFSIDTRHNNWVQVGPGVEIQQLHHFGSEVVTLVRLQTDGSYQISCAKPGYEILVLSGALFSSGENYNEGAWIRSPATSAELRSKTLTVFYLKTGHLS